MSASAPLAVLAQGSGPLSPSEILSRFLTYVADQGLTLYPAQEEAILELVDDKHVVLATPTGSGKSLVALALHFKALAEGKTSVYTAPIKALVNEKFFALCQAFGPEKVGMLTGDASINRDAPILCCTAEILSNLALREPNPRVDAVVMDEFHYYADAERGVAWQIPLLLLPKASFLLMSATLGNTSRIEQSLAQLSGRKVAHVESAGRPVPLDYAYSEDPLHEAIQKLIEANKYPVYLVNFTQRSAAEQAQNLMSVDYCTKEEKEELKRALDGVRFDSPYGKELQRYLRHGLGLHHAGLLPKYRLLVEKLSQKGLLKVVSGTDTLGMGVNIPLRTVLFTQLCKFDGEKTAILSVRDFHQIAGRAGRKGFDTQGSVVVQAPEHVIENKKLAQKEAQGKKVVKQKPPQKGYVHWDKSTFERLLSQPPEPLQSRFSVSHGMLLHLLQSSTEERGGGYGRLVRLIGLSHESDHMKRKLRQAAAQQLHALVGAGLVKVERQGRRPRPVVSAELQRDFSLNQTLSLYLLDILPKLDRESEVYALDLLTMVESILENPQAVLFKQLDKLKGEKVGELKAQGVEYEQRMEELDKLEWPKPHRDFIYATFNEFAAKHPWVGQENIRPKSVAREMMELYCSFDDYVREYGLQRSEGVLLRYLSDVYKTLVQTVPASYRGEEVEDLIAQLKAMLRAVDSSLLDEWELLKDPLAALKQREAPAAPEHPRDILDDPRAFAARVRNELHRLVKALADKRFDDAAVLLHPPGAWSAEALRQAATPYFEEHPAIDTTPRARRPQHTFLKPSGPRRFEARQKLFDPAEPPEEAMWMLDCVVDLSAPRPEEAPLLELIRIGT